MGGTFLHSLKVEGTGLWVGSECVGAHHCVHTRRHCSPCLKELAQV